MMRMMRAASALLVSGLAFAAACGTRAATPAPVTFEAKRVGPPPFARPTITNVQILDLDGNGSAEVLACDAQTQAVYAYRRTGPGEWSEQKLADGLIAPAHATVVDLDEDGDNDVVVSVMGDLYPDDDVVGSLVLLENQGGKFVNRTLLDDVRRVVDAQPGDFDGDGDVDLAVAVFGYLRGQVLWLENRGGGQFRDHELLSAAGTIHVPVADYDGDGDLDIAAVLSQEDEEVWGFENLGAGKFAPRRLWMTINFDNGAAGLVASDIDGDHDIDLLLPVGDNLEDSYSIPQPYHGCFWLENKGGWQFAAQRIATFPGTYAAAIGDLDGDGDQDAALVSMVNHWDDPAAPSLVWLENDGRQHFTQHPIATDPIMLVTVACGDVDGDGRSDLVAGGLHLHRPYERMGRITCWLNRGKPASNADAPDQVAAASDSAHNAASTDKGPPLPDLSFLDPLTRNDLQGLHDRLRDKDARGATPASDWLDLGQAYYAFGYFAAAERSFAEAVARDGKSPLPHFLWGASLARRGLLPEAITELTRTLPKANAQQQSWIWFEIGRCQLRLEDAKAAEEAFVKSAGYAPSLVQLAKLRLRAGRAREAVAPINQLATTTPHSTEAYLVQARVAAELGDVAQSQQLRDRAEYNDVTLPPDPVAAIMAEVRKKYGSPRRVLQARTAIAAKHWQEAATLLSSLVDEHPEIETVVLFAGAELESGQPQRAIELLQDLLKARGNFPVAMLLLGDAYHAAGDEEKARQWWESTAAARTSPGLHQRLAKSYEQSGRAEDARRQRALGLQATGIAQLRHADPSAARRSLESAVAMEPTLAQSWFYLGECRRILGDAAGARDAYGEAVRLDPNHGRALAAIDLLPK